jgi:hypothetical protein
MGESVKKPCPICKGRKVVDAAVNIDWKEGGGL